MNMDFKEILKDLEGILADQRDGRIRLDEIRETSLRNFKAQKSISSHKNFESLMQKLLSLQSSAPMLITDNVRLAKFFDNLKKAKNIYETKDFNALLEIIAVLRRDFDDVKARDAPSDVIFTVNPRIPQDIKDEISADVKELERCYKSDCFRSVIILCGRLLETALHRKYYDATGRDILETSPEIGLGNLVKKLNEKNIEFDPGLTQQIHLINQVRVFSVHKKQKPFYPSKSQAGATILYTLDILEKIF